MGLSQSTEKDEKKVYGWKPDMSDIRDIKLNFDTKQIDNIKTKVDLREDFCNIYNQKNLGSCTSQALCSAFSYDQKKTRFS